KLSKLAQLWVNGAGIEWKILPQNIGCRRVSLPPYPFARERHWVAVPASSVSVSDWSMNPAQAACAGQDQLGGVERALSQGQIPGLHPLAGLHPPTGLHPLIGSNTSTLREQKFSTWLSGSEFFLADHVVGEHKVLPGVAYLEMARAAGEISGERRVRKLKDIVWAQPITVTASPQQVHISLYPQQQDRVEYEVSTMGEDNRRVVHSQGKLVYEEREENKKKKYQEEENRKSKAGITHKGFEAAPGADFIDIEAIKVRCQGLKSSQECYHAFQTGGIQYGPGFQTIRELFFNGKEALARLEVPRNLKGSIHAFGLHPSLMDGALQTVAGLMPDKAEGQEKSSADALYLPFALGEVEIISPLLPETCYAYVTVAEDKPGKKLSARDLPARDLPAENLPSARSRVKRYNIQLADEDGQVLVSMKDFSLRALRQPQKGSRIISGISGNTEARKAQAGGTLVSQADGVLVKQADEELVRMYCRSVWEKSGECCQAIKTAEAGQDVVVAEGAALSGHVLIFETHGNTGEGSSEDAIEDTNVQVSQLMQEMMTARGENRAQLIIVKPGQEYREIGELMYEINPGNRQDYFRLIENLASRQVMPDIIFHLWSLWPPGPMGPMNPEGDYPTGLNPASQPDFKAWLDQGMYSICYLSQALMEQKRAQEQKSRRKVRLLYVYPSPGDYPQPQYAAASGLIKTIRLENPRLIYKAVGLESKDSLALDEEGENIHHPHPASPATGAPCLKGEEWKGCTSIPPRPFGERAGVRGCMVRSNKVMTSPWSQPQSRATALEILSILLAELCTGCEDEVDIRYEGGQRFVRRWQEIAFGSETDKDTQDDAGKGTQDDTDKANQDQIPALL
ncbi:MAG: polyketide synthase dehydratase domain-containing protein, partial [bacterium]